MDRFEIQGGAPLKGRIAVRPAKNALLPCMAASLLTGEPLRFSDTARLQDITSMAELLHHLGVKVEGAPGGPMTLTADDLGTFEAPYDLVRKMRASILVLGPLLARFGQARVSLPGGCAIGTRPIDQHLKALEALGAEIAVEHGFVTARAKRLRGAEIVFDLVTVGGTENLLMAAALAGGETVLHNAAREPEVGDLCRLLKKMGVAIDGVDTDTLRIRGAKVLRGAAHACVPDRIEAGTLAVAACITGGNVLLDGAVAEHLEAFFSKLRQMGVRVELEPGGVRVSCPEEAYSADIATSPFPGFPTDLQAQFLALLTQCRGTGIVRETIFENRFMHVPELCRMGADIEVQGALAVVKGPARLTGAPVMASDLRASACLVLAGLCAKGTTAVRRIYHLDRGYERLEERLNSLGARIRRVQE
jgi:UDP-N-acetylglucosamine 1-carboxyvinyltransferase